MPRGLTTPIKAEIAKTAWSGPIYGVRITRIADVLRWSDRTVVFNDGTPAQSYTARLVSIGGMDFSADEAGAITLTLANPDGAITTLDRTESFAGAKLELLAYLPDIDTFYIVWTGWCDEISELTPETATLQAYPTVAMPNVQIPKRTLGLACTHEFGNTANWVNALDFEGSECPYQRVSTVGFTGSVDADINAAVTSLVAVVGSGYAAAGMEYKASDELLIGSERLLVTAADAMTGAWKQTLTVTRGYRSTSAATHLAGATILFKNCQYSTAACTRRGMYGNNSLDTYGAAKKRNYFGGFPQVTGFISAEVQAANRSQRLSIKRLSFSGNDSAYGRILPLVYGKARIADPILLIAKPDNSGNFLDTFWLVAEGVLATNAADDAQTVPGDAYVKTAGVENIFVNGVSRHDPRPGYGIEVANGEQDRSEPSAAFFPSGAGQVDDFIINNLGFWGTARVAFRINTKANPSVDVQGQLISGAFEVAYGRVVRVYSDGTTFARKATTSPAWVAFDVVTSKRAGGGLDSARLNIQSFIDVAGYCAESITSTLDGSSVPRWTFNGILDQRKSFNEWLHLISISMYCLPPFMDNEGLLKIRALKSETLTGIPIFSSKAASVTGRNIVWEGERSSLVKSRRSVTEIPNEITVNFIDKSDYAKVSVVVADREAQSELGRKWGDQSRRAISKSIDLPGTSTLDEAARLATLLLRAGEFGQGGLSNNLRVTFQAFYRDAEDLEIGDVIEVEDDLLDPALNERYFRVTHISAQPIPVNDGGLLIARQITAVLHANAIYDDTALTVSKFERIAAPGPNDSEPPAVTDFAIAEVGAFDNNGNPISIATFTFTKPVPLENYRSLIIYKSNDTAGNPVGDWRFVGELLESGETIEIENTGNFQHFAAVSRSASGHPGSIDSLDAAGAFKYPRLRILIDGVTDVLPAPANPQIFVGSGIVTLRWDAYTGDNLKLFKQFRVYRNTANDLGTATLLTSLDGTQLADLSVAPSTVYWYWIKGVSILNIEGAATSALSTTSPDSGGTDVAVPTVPVLGILRNLASFNANEYSWMVGIDRPGGASNWGNISETELQISTDISFAAFPTGKSLNRTYTLKPPFTEIFSVNAPGTYYFRAQVKNSFGWSGYTSILTRTTHVLDNVTADTAIPPVPDNFSVDPASGDPSLAGNQFKVSFEIPPVNTASYWGYAVMIHDSATLPTATTQETGTAGAITAGSVVLTDLTKAWSVNAYVGKDLVIFDPTRGGSPTFDYEGLAIMGKIVSNTATTITMELPPERQYRTYATCKYYVVNNNAGHHFWEKLKFTTPALINEGVLALTEERGTRKRELRFSSSISQVWAWVALYNLFGMGKVTASPPTATYDGITTGEIKLLAIDNSLIAENAITETKISDDSISTPKLQANSVTAEKIDVTDLFAQTIAATGSITGALLRTAASGGRVEIDSTNGLRAYNSAGTLITHIPLAAGFIQTSILTGISLALILQSEPGGGGGNILMQSGAITFQISGDACRVTSSGLIFESGKGVYFGDVTSGGNWQGTGTRIDGNIGSVNTFRVVDNGSSTTLAPIFIMYNGSLTQVQYDNSDLGSGAKKYLYIP